MTASSSSTSTSAAWTARARRWPWGRDKIVALLQKLFDKYGVSLIGSTSYLPSPTTAQACRCWRGCPRPAEGRRQFQSALKELRPQLEYDALFADFLRGRPVVLGYYFSSDENAVESGALPEPVLHRHFRQQENPFRNLERLRRKPAGVSGQRAQRGHFNTQTTTTAYRGASRCSWNTRAVITRRFPSRCAAVLGLKEAARNGSKTVVLPKVVPGIAPERFGSKNYTAEWLEVGPLRIPLDDEVTALVPIAAPSAAFPTFRLRMSGGQGAD